jgi:hypothetical protein
MGPLLLNCISFLLLSWNPPLCLNYMQTVHNISQNHRFLNRAKGIQLGTRTDLAHASTVDMSLDRGKPMAS